MRRIHWLLLLVIALSVLPALGDSILLLQDGEEIRVGGLAFNGHAFTLPDGRLFDRSRVSEVRFESAAPMGEIDWQFDAQRYQRLFAKGRELAEKYPNRPGVILEDIGEYTLNADGTNEHTYRFVGLILKEKAKHWGIVPIGADPNRDEVEGPFGVVIHPDGTFQVAGDENRTRTSPYAGTVFFNRYHVYRLTIPEVGVGDIVEYWYKSKNVRPINGDFFFTNYFFQDTSPIAISRMDVHLPPGKKLYYSVSRFPADLQEPVTQTRPDGSSTYRWAMHDVEPFESEPNMPNRAELVPRVRARVMPSWDPIFDHLTEFYNSRMVVTDRVREVTEDVVGDLQDVDEKIAGIYHFVQRKIRYISIKTDFGTGFTGHAAEVTLANGYGDCTDKAILLATMLKAIGIEAHPIVLGTWGLPRDVYEVPSLGGNHAINKVFLDGREFFLDATASTYRYPTFRWDDHGRPYYDSLGRTVGFIDRPDPEANLDLQKWELVIDEQGGAEVTLVDSSTGIWEAIARSHLERLDARKREKGLRQMVLGYGPGATLVSFADENVNDLLKPLKQSVVFRLPVLAKKNGDLWVIDLPDLPGRDSRVDKETRRSDLLFPVQYISQFEYIVHLPANWQLVDFPKNESIKTPLFDFEATYEPIEGGFKLTYRITRRDTEVTAEQYPDYRRDKVAMEAFFARRAFAKEVTP